MLYRSKQSGFSNSDFDDSNLTLNASMKDDILESTTIASEPRVSPTFSERIHETTHIEQKPPNGGLNATLGSLKIGTPNKDLNRSLPNGFTPRNLFTEKTSNKLNSSQINNKSILTPPRLSTKQVTQASWVAGGYWGTPGSPQRNNLNKTNISNNNHDSTLFPLSRSSSQSSGFVSHCSGPVSYANQGPFSLPNSRQGSICGDYEKASVLSEPPYFSWNYQSSDCGTQFSSLCRHASQNDIQSVYKSPSVFSEPNSVMKAPCNSTFLEPSQNSSTASISPESDIAKLSSLLNYRNPWVAFLLGVSVAANGFLLAILFKSS